MPEIEEYQIVSATDIAALVAAVTAAIAGGWQPFGAAFDYSHRIEGENRKKRLHQAMVKYAAA